ncbi:MAG TPA: endonuclease/exonuclease/phosphatase family protein [Rhodopila sp.]|nr:endonuclease/exonuclease/phosphatase family protein [Rhodopila sp.]
MTRLLLILALWLPLPAFATELKVATWNLDWLTTRRAGDPGLPADVVPRSDGDFARLAQYAQDLRADLIAIQEVDGFAAASRVFPRDQYSIHMTHDHVVQRVGIVVRRGLHYDINPDVTALGGHHLRSGADITLHLGGADLRVLAVHLKKGCRDVPMAKARSEACQELKEQIGPLADWIAARKAEAVPFIILGDFNRWMDPAETFLASLRQAAPLVRATQGHSSPCWGNESFIDHILAGGRAVEWMRVETLRVMTYREVDPTWKDRLSDHCPVSVRLGVPG